MTLLIQPGAFSKMGNIKMDFNKSNVSFWLTQLEIKMGFCGIGKQYTKLQALTSQLPSDIAEELPPDHPDILHLYDVWHWISKYCIVISIYGTL